LAAIAPVANPFANPGHHRRQQVGGGARRAGRGREAFEQGLGVAGRSAGVALEVQVDVRAAERRLQPSQLGVGGGVNLLVELRQERALEHLPRRDRSIVDQERRRSRAAGDRGRDRVGLAFGRAVGRADLDLALRHRAAGRALLHDVGELVGHEAEVAIGLASAEIDVGPVREGTGPHRGVGLLAERVVVDLHRR
jgi:hypothetical protein